MQSSKATGSDTPEDTLAVIAGILKGKRPYSYIRRMLNVGNSTIGEARKAHGIKPNPSMREISATIKAKLSAVTDEQWEMWKAENATVTRVSAEVGVHERQVSAWCIKNGRKFWTGISGRKWKKHLKGYHAMMADHAESTRSDWRPTRQEYADLCDREFATPPFLRKAPAMLREIEAYEAADRKLMNKRPR